MTYCVGILVSEGLVMIADTRTNAGVDNIAVFRKLHVFETAGERVITVATAGNLSISQSVLAVLSEGIEDPQIRRARDPPERPHAWSGPLASWDERSGRSTRPTGPTWSGETCRST